MLAVDTMPTQHWPLLSFAMGLAVVDAGRSVGAPLLLKWPNDVIVNDHTSLIGYRKLAGILAESAVVGGHTRVVVGVGVNMFRPSSLDPKLGPEAVPTWLSDHVDAISADEFTATVLQSFDVALRQLHDGAPTFLSRYQSECATLGQAVRVELGDGQLLGTATAVDDEGRLIVMTADGQKHVVSAGDVIHVRPT
jgi:BirA family transcriptional regulator, biotin operon repressor / biotin---[acetyl-CoA-carboxylase] ligase